MMVNLKISLLIFLKRGMADWNNPITGASFQWQGKELDSITLKYQRTMLEAAGHITTVWYAL